jgi:8-oxo-dGTP pyrophosphatase MutT (NUDIX family)
MRDRIVCSGALFYSKKTKRVLLVQKSKGKHQGTWSLVGGTSLATENPWQTLTREIVEEIGSMPNVIKSIPLETFVSNDNVFNFHTFLCVVQDEFIPVLSDEHNGWAWTSIDSMPKPLHQGLRSSLSNRSIRNKLQTVFDIMNII